MADAPLASQLAALQQRIADACAATGRDAGQVRLLAVSKTVPPGRLRQAHACGLDAFGENYVQEALAKQDALRDLAPEWHFIGPIQSNKTAAIAQHFGWAHGVERLRIAQRLSDQRPPQCPPLNVCVQVNVSGEVSKSGCAPAEALALCQQVAPLPGLKLRGLMTLPAPSATLADPRAPFRTLRQLFEQVRSAGLPLDTLSMGMSDDFAHAIAEGATLLRIGSALFGAR